MFGTSVNSVRVKKLNLDFECMYDLVMERGIRIDSVESYQTKEDKFSKKIEKIPNGLQSEFFGSDCIDTKEHVERWSCKCKKYIGKSYRGKVCPRCNTVVEHHEADLTRTGWIILDHFMVINPLYAEKLTKALGSIDGESILKKIIEIQYVDETRKPTEKEKLQMRKHPFLHKGMIWLSNPDNFEKVLNYYRPLRGKKHYKKFDELYEDRYQVFTHSIPVYSAILRTELPGEKNGKLFTLKINKYFKAIIRSTNNVNVIEKDDYEMNEIAINKELATIQKKLSEVFTDVLTSLTNKQGDFCSKVVGGRYNFSARNIITPSSGYLRADEIELCYSTFMELYRSELTNFYRKINKCTDAEAASAWKKATTHFDETFYDIMMYMVQDEECKKYMNVLICRNPCRLCTA